MKNSKPRIEASGKIKREQFLEKEITFDDTFLDYGNGPVIKGINLTLAKGETIAFVGESGAGKTSILNLLTKVYAHTGGGILIDGTSINDFDLNYLRTKIAVVHQDSFLFNQSVKDNILLAKPDASFDEIVAASEKAFAKSFIEDLPEGYDTLIGDRGVKLSGGQRQRINISQALLKDAEVIIFDEATSSLDTKSERYIQQSIDSLRGEKTCFIIAHRLSTIKEADRIVVLEDGKIKEVGSWTELSHLGGKFSEMLSHQLI